jgi:hypothetical protein
VDRQQIRYPANWSTKAKSFPHEVIAVMYPHEGHGQELANQFLLRHLDVSWRLAILGNLP